MLQEQSSRHVDGIAEELERDLHLGKNVSFYFIFVCCFAAYDLTDYDARPLWVFSLVRIKSEEEDSQS